MRADFAVKLLGIKLVGLTVDTPAMGEYPGGKAKVVSISPKNRNHDIAFFVQHPTWTNDDGDSVMGIFDYEDINIFEEE